MILKEVLSFSNLACINYIYDFKDTPYT